MEEQSSGELASANPTTSAQDARLRAEDQPNDYSQLTRRRAPAALDAISGRSYSTFSSSMVQGAPLFMNNFANQTGGGGSPVSNLVALAEACDIACDGTLPPQWGAWGGALGGLGTIGGSASTGGVTYNVGGFAAGLDRLVAPSFRAGVTVGYTTGTQWTSGFSGNGTTDNFLTSLYVRYEGNLSGQDSAHALTAGVRMTW